MAEEISLETCAKVHAALSSGHPLARALAWADVPAERWAAEERRWTERLAESAAGDCSLVLAYDAHLLEAESQLAPEIEPIEGDLSAWVTFSRHWMSAVSPDRFLEEQGASAMRIVRVQRQWSRRLERDAEIKKRASELAREPLGPPPKLSLRERPLLPSASRRSPEPDVGAAGLQVAPLLPAAPAPTPAPPGGPAMLDLSAPEIEVMNTVPEDFEGGSTLPIPSDRQRRSPASPLPFAAVRIPPEPVAPRAPGAAAPEPDDWARRTIGLATAPDPVAALPFNVRPSPQASPAQRAAPAHGVPFRPAGAAPAAPAAAAPPAAAPPAAAPAAAAPRVPSLTLEHYAWLCFELQRDPGKSSEIRARYGVADDAVWSIVYWGWQERLRSDAALQWRWLELLAQMRASRGR